MPRVQCERMHWEDVDERAADQSSSAQVKKMRSLKAQGKKATASLIHQELSSNGYSETLDLMLDDLLTPDKNIADTDNIEWCKWIIASGKSPNDFSHQGKKSGSSNSEKLSIELKLLLCVCESEKLEFQLRRMYLEFEIPDPFGSLRSSQKAYKNRTKHMCSMGRKREKHRSNVSIKRSFDFLLLFFSPCSPSSCCCCFFIFGVLWSFHYIFCFLCERVAKRADREILLHFAFNCDTENLNTEKYIHILCKAPHSSHTI